MADEDQIGDVDIDKSTIEIDDEWLTLKELKSTIKTKIESGDFDVTLYATALKKLESTMKSIEEVEFLMPVSVLQAYKDLAKDSSISVESCLRNGVTEYLRKKDKLKPMEQEEEFGSRKSKRRSR